MGIFTKLVVKLFPFQPEPFIPTGVGTDAAVVMPPRTRYQNYTLPTEEDLVEAMAEIAREQIGGAMNRVPAFWRTIAKAKGRQPFWDMWNEMTYEEAENTHILRVLFIGFTSLKQLEYEMQVVEDIVVKEHGGTARRTKQTDEGTFLYANVTGMWSMTGFYASAVVGSESSRCTLGAEFELGDRIDDEEPWKSIFMPMYKERPWYSPFDFRRTMYSEFMQFPDCEMVDPADPKFNPDVTGGVLMWIQSIANGTLLKYGFNSLFGNGVLASALLQGPAKHDYHVWVDRVHGEFDPKDLASPMSLRGLDAILAGAPALINDEFKANQAKAMEYRWKDAELADVGL